MIRRLYSFIERAGIHREKTDPLLKGILDGSRAFTGPRIVQFDITNRCNNHCLCCWNNSPLLGQLTLQKRKEKEYELPFGLVKKVIGELRRMGTKSLFFAGGGEPFMHPRIMDILAYAKKCGMRVCLNTNFTLVDRKTAKGIVDLKIDLIHASILAGTAQTYSQVHPGNDEEAFYRIKDTLGYLINYRNAKKQDAPVPLPHIDLYYVIFNKNYHEIDAMTALAMELRANTLEFTPADVIPGKTDALLLNESQRQEVVRAVQLQHKVLDEFNRRNGGKVTFIEQYDSFLKRLSALNAPKGEYEVNTVTHQPCYVGWAFARILANGNVNPCLKAHRISVGNIYRQAFKDTWNNRKQQMFRNKTFALNKNDRYFGLIGNSPGCAFGCLNSCDNIQINVEMHRKYQGSLRKA